jgi:hypothetical protein
MRHPGWLAAVLAVTVLVAAVTSAGRVFVGLLRGRRGYCDVDLTHALMGVSMAGMFVASFSVLRVVIWQDVFTVVLAWHAIRAIARSRNRSGPRQGLLFQTGHLMSVAVMLYMLRSASSATARAMNAPDTPMSMALPDVQASVHPQVLSLLIATLLVAYAGLVINQAGRVPRPNVPAGADSLPFAPRAAAAAVGEAAMCAAMAAMLVAPP